MTIGGVPPNFHKPWFINPGLTLFNNYPFLPLCLHDITMMVAQKKSMFMVYPPN